MYLLVVGVVNTTVALIYKQDPQLQQKQCRRQSFQQNRFHHWNHQKLLLNFEFHHRRA